MTLLRTHQLKYSPKDADHELGVVVEHEIYSEAVLPALRRQQLPCTIYKAGLSQIESWNWRLKSRLTRGEQENLDLARGDQILELDSAFAPASRSPEAILCFPSFSSGELSSLFLRGKEFCRFIGTKENSAEDHSAEFLVTSVRVAV